ncbi:hypothetical protein EJ110_NYTH17572 [Nymphaea thermarum]|nr:hypothetical protein EJ110_NYTH17572 [Nymphaea thermarum]
MQVGCDEEGWSSIDSFISNDKLDSWVPHENPTPHIYAPAYQLRCYTWVWDSFFAQIVATKDPYLSA